VSGVGTQMISASQAASSARRVVAVKRSEIAARVASAMSSTWLWPEFSPATLRRSESSPTTSIPASA
jgi:hypothetical protein